MKRAMPHLPLQSARASGSKQSGAFDLPSVLIGVAVVAILAIGVMATIFGVIPWAQDRAAKQDLAAMNTAQGTAYARDGSFADKAALVAAGWLGDDTPEALDAKADTEGGCYVAVTTSKTGNRFVISHDRPTPRGLTAADTWCTGSPIGQVADTAPVMITTWDTTLAETCSEIALPVSDFVGTVTWGDGATDTEISHTFAISGPVTVRIDGTFGAWGDWSWDDAECLVSVDRWGSTATTDLSYAFYHVNNLRHIEEIPDTTTSLNNTFTGVTSDFTIGNFDTSKVESMYGMFSSAKAFNQPLDFDTSSVTDMGSMFNNAAAFNQPINFDTSSVTQMGEMFTGAAAFNQPLNFDTSKVGDMYGMFNNAVAFNQPLDFDTSRVESMYGMFNRADAFNQDLSEWNVSKVTSYGDFYFSWGEAWTLPRPNWVN